MNRTLLIGALACLLAAGLASHARAQVPELISYQGVLTLSDGTVVADGLYELRFSILDQPTGGMEHYAQTLSIQVTDGLYNVILSNAGQGTLADALAPSAGPRYVQVEILSGPSVSQAVTLDPRQQIASVPYALHAGDAVDRGELGTLDGRLVYVDGDSVELQPSYSGLLRVEIDGEFYEQSSSVSFSISADLDSGSEAADTFYYLYLSGDGQTIAPHVSATSPTVSLPGKVGYHPTNTGWRFIQAVRNNPSSDVWPFDAPQPDRVTLRSLPPNTTGNPWPVQETNIPTLTTTFSLASLASFVPGGAAEATLEICPDSGGSALLWGSSSLETQTVSQVRAPFRMIDENCQPGMITIDRNSPNVALAAESSVFGRTIRMLAWAY